MAKVGWGAVSNLCPVSNLGGSRVAFETDLTRTRRKKTHLRGSKKPQGTLKGSDHGECSLGRVRRARSTKRAAAKGQPSDFQGNSADLLLMNGLIA